MLVRSIPREQHTTEAPKDNEFISLADILTFVRRYFISILAFAVAGAALAAFLVLTTDRIYSAEAQILIEPKLPQYLQQQSGGVSTSLDTAQIESQIAVMRSEKIAQMVIDDLSLMDNPDFFILHDTTLRERLGRFSQIIAKAMGYDETEQPWFVSLFADDPTAKVAGKSLTEFERGRVAIAIFSGNIDIRRVGVSYALAIAFRSRNPELAAEITNATAHSFVQEQVETKAAAAREGGEWLEQRMGEMRAKMNTATQLAQEFRSRHDYRVRAPDAKLVNGQVVYDDVPPSSADSPTLEELEVTADTYRQMYESFLLAYTNNLSQQSYPVPDARVITAATQPLSPSYPRKKLSLAFGMLAGLMAGVGVAFARHTLDRTVRSPRQVRERLGLECLGELPATRGRNGGLGLIDEVAATPRSKFSESLRRARIAIRLAGGNHKLTSIGVTSAFPDEGKGTVATNLALLYAMAGQRTILIDADTEHSGLSKRMLQDPIAREGTRLPQTSCNVIPRAVREVDMLPLSTIDPRDVSVLPDCSDYDMVVVNLPPLTAGPDGLALSAEIGGVVLVAEWGRTSLEKIEELTLVIQSHNAPILGVLLTKCHR